MPPQRRSITAATASLREAAAVTPDPERRTDPDWRVGDFTLVSCDEVVFKIDSFRLLGASAVFRDAHGVGSSTKRHVVFTDPELESSTVLRMFLQLLVSGTLPASQSKHCRDRYHDHKYDGYCSGSSSSSGSGSGPASKRAKVRYGEDDFRYLLDFCNKYECPVVRQSALYFLRELAHTSELTAMQIFRLGAAARDVDTCVAVLRVQSVDLGGLPVAERMTLPVEYLWALEHRRGDHRHRGTAIAYRRCTPNGFKAMVLLAEKYSRELAPTGPPPQEWYRHPDWDSGDLELLASDGISFLVPSYHVFSASTPLREAILSTSESSYSFRFDCRETEKSRVIGMFLELIITGMLSFSTALTLGCHPSMVDVDNLAAFLKRYECQAALHSLLLQVRQLLSLDPRLAYDSFVIGAIADEPALCLEAVRTGHKRTWKLDELSLYPEDGDDAYLPEDTTPIFDVRTWSFRQWRKVPLQYIAALRSAHRRRTIASDLFPKIFYLQMRGLQLTDAVDRRVQGLHVRALDCVSARTVPIDQDAELLSDRESSWSKDTNDSDFDPFESVRDTEDDYETDSQASEVLDDDGLGALRDLSSDAAPADEFDDDEGMVSVSDEPSDADEDVDADAGDSDDEDPIVLGSGSASDS